MSDLTAYTSYEEVRAALGVTHKELSNDVLSLELYSASLENELETVGEGVAAAFATAAAAVPRTPVQQRFYRAVKLFAPYAVANELVSGLPLFAIKSVTDGKAGFSRDSSSPYKESIIQALARYSKYRGQLESAFSEITGGTTDVTDRSYLAVISPASDPVLGT